MASAPRRIVGPLGLVPLLLVALCAPGCRREPTDWLADLGHADPFVRTLAVVALGRAPGPLPPEVGSALVLALQDPSAEVCARAKESLRQRAAELVRHQHAMVAAAAAAALDGRDEASRALLLEVVTSGEPTVRAAAATSLAPAARSSDTVRAALLAACGDSDESAAAAARAALVPALVVRLASARPDVVERAGGQLAALGAPGLRAVADALAAGDGAMLRSARIGSEKAAQVAARDWLAARGSAAIVPLLEAFGSPIHPFDLERLARLETCLLAFGPEAVPPLLAELAGPEAGRRAAAAAALAGLRGQARPATPALLAALDDDVELVRVAAAHALLHVGIEDGAVLLALADRAEGESDSAGQHIRRLVAASLLRPTVVLDPRLREDLWLRLEQHSPRAAWLDVLATGSHEPELEAAARAALAALPAH